jgi:hypothetical protein
MTTTAFETRTRDNGETFVALTDDAPEWLRDAVYDAHGGLLPDDWTYAACSNLLDLLAECDDVDADPYFDDDVDVYTSDLLDWARSHTSDIDDVLAEWRPDTLCDAIMIAQALELGRILRIIRHAASGAYSDYIAECEAETLDPHGFHMWTVHGFPTSPLG